MNISYKWLRQYVDLNATPEEVAKVLTSIGLECGGVEEVESVKGGLKGLVVGEVLTCVAHENSDHLHVTTVCVKEGEEPLQVVCGAPNVRAGLKVVVATIGTKLYSGDEEWTIKRSKIRGVESEGMLCAEDEIGVGKSHDGIIELPADTPVGMVVAEFYGVESDWVLEVDVTPNRADAISHYGVARDLAAYYAARGVDVHLHRPSVESFKVEGHDFEVKVTVEDGMGCPRYSGVSLTGVKVEESPEWLRRSLTAVGVKPINNVVDVTNYVMHAVGQPMHAFDGDMLKGNEVRVKRLAEGTPFTTLDGVERKLRSEDVMICNAKEGMCIAGVMGGKDSGITERTTRVFLESAYFNPVSVRKTARAHGLSTDASFRYERGCDPNGTLYALKYAALLIKELAGGHVSSEVTDVYPVPVKGFEVNLSFAKLDSLTGIKIERDVLRSILRGLEIEVVKEDADGLQLVVPPYRVDVQRDVDVIEDVLRIYGYDKVPFVTGVKGCISYTKSPDTNRLQDIVSGQLTGCGFREIMNNSLTKLSYYQDLSCLPEGNCVKVMNPLGVDLSVLRQTLLFGGLESIARNRNYKNYDLKFYEFGKCYYFDENRRKEGVALSPYSEDYHLGIWMCGNKTSQSWTVKEERCSFYTLKAHVENVLARIGVERRLTVTGDYADDLMNEALRVYSRRGNLLVTMGIVGNGVLKQCGVEGTEVYFADLNWSNLMREIKDAKTIYTEIAKYPEVRRDLALLIDKGVTFAEIEKIARETERNLLKEVNLFDVYEGKNLPAGKKSYAVSFILQDAEKTLKDAQIEGIMQRLIKNLTEKLNATLR